MLAAVLLVVLGLVLLAGGGELLVRGATTIASLAGLTPAVIGLTVVALGTSLPELVVSVMAAARGQPDLAVGNVVGSNMANITLILGLTALLIPLPILGEVVRREYPFLLVVTIACLLLVRDGMLSRLEAWAFLVTLVVFLAWVVHLARREVTPVESQELADEVAGKELPSRLRTALVAGGLTAGGIALLVVGGRFLVDGSVHLAELAGLSPRVIGLTIVAVGTSAPEIATSLVAAFRRQTDVAVANLIGSNVFNTLGILGVAGATTALPVSPEFAGYDMVWMLGATVLIFPLMRMGMRLSRLDGLILLATYGIYLRGVLTG